MEQKVREEIAQLHAHICGGLADSNRILLLYLLADEPHNVTDLAHRLGLPQPTVSRHLKILRERGIVCAERDGQYVADARVRRRRKQPRAGAGYQRNASSGPHNCSPSNSE